MYLWIWGRLPGRGWVRVSQALALVAIAAAACCVWLFPVVDRLTSGSNVVHGSGSSAIESPAGPPPSQGR